MDGNVRGLRAYLNIDNIDSDIHAKLLRTLIEEAPVGAFMISLGEAEREGRIIYANPGFCKIFGYAEEECKAMPQPWEFIHPEDRKSIDETFRMLPAGGKGHCEARGLRGDGTVVNLDIIASINTFEDMPSIVGTAIDITEKKNREKEKEDFFAMVTHDLKGPLTSIIGYTELILSKEETMDEGTLKMLEVVAGSAHKLNLMIDSFLIISKLETGNINIKPEPEDISSILRGLEKDFYPAAKRKGIEFVTDIPAVLPVALVDRRYIERAVSNLLQNAFKFTPSGGKVTLKAGMDEAGQENVVISVEDTGPGIPEEDINRIFDKYYRSHAAKDEKGVGLGLVIVKDAAKAHGGRVSVQSEPGKGSIFKIILPLHPEKASKAA